MPNTRSLSFAMRETIDHINEAKNAPTGVATKEADEDAHNVEGIRGRLECRKIENLCAAIFGS